MNKKFWIAVFTAGYLTGCTTSSQYYWLDYEEKLYDYYHKPAKKTKVVNSYIDALEKADKSGRKLAPGLYAEAGSFMLERGDRARALAFFKLERNAWPESASLMDALITHIEQDLEAKK